MKLYLVLERNLYHGEGSEKESVEDVGDWTEYVLDLLVEHEHRNGVLYFKIRWYDCVKEEDTWEPRHGLHI